MIKVRLGSWPGRALCPAVRGIALGLAVTGMLVAACGSGPGRERHRDAVRSGQRDAVRSGQRDGRL